MLKDATYSTISSIHDVPTTWVYPRNENSINWPAFRTGSVTIPCTDIVVYDSYLVYLSIIINASERNMQEIEHIMATLLASKGQKNQKVASVNGAVHTYFDGRFAPDSPEWKQRLVAIKREESSNIERAAQHQAFMQRSGHIVSTSPTGYLGISKSWYFNAFKEWSYHYESQSYADHNAIETVIYSPDVFETGHGIWMLPIMTPQKERERLFLNEVLKRCPTIQCAQEWAAWLYSWCEREQFDPMTEQRITPRFYINCAGRFVAFKLDLREEMIRQAISQAVRQRQLPSLLERVVA